MDNQTQEIVDRVLVGWAATSAPWKAEAVAKGDVSDMCILAAGACASVMTGDFGLEVSVMGVDLYAWSDDTAEYEVKVEHPEGASALQAGGYLGHVVAVVESGDQQFIVDAELGVVAPFNGLLATGESDGGRYLYRPRAEHVEFSETEAWAKRGQAAAALSEHLLE